MKEVQNVSKIRRHGFYGKLVWRFGILILMFMLVGIGYRFRDIEYELMADTSSIKSGKVEEVTEKKSEDYEDFPEDINGRSKAKLENIKSQEDENRRYTGSVWPLPKHQIIQTDFANRPIVRSIGKVEINLNPQSKSCTLFQSAFERYELIMNRAIENSKNAKTIVQVKVDDCDEIPHQKMNEKYILLISDEEIQINALTEWGILKGLETLAQLIIPSPPRGVYLQQIEDWPRYSYRGLLVDTSRHFYPLPVLKAIITSLSWLKMNVFHWHMTDHQSFSFETNLSDEVFRYGQKMKYSHDDVKEIIEYSRVRGIRVIPEFDTPGHTLSWKGLMKVSECVPKSHVNGILDGSIDPTHENNYKVMNDLLKEISELFIDEYIHLGGDEVSLDCWLSDPKIVKWADENLPNKVQGLEAYWLNKIQKMAAKNGQKSMIWEEAAVNGTKLAKDTIVQIWKYRETGNNAMLMAEELQDKGHFVVMNAHYYLDKNAIGDLDMPDWFKDIVHDFSLIDARPTFLGGEASIWSETIDSSNIFTKIFPRLHAIAFKLWAPKSKSRSPVIDPTRQVLQMLQEWTCRVHDRGLPSGPIIKNLGPATESLSHCGHEFDPFNSVFLY